MSVFTAPTPDVTLPITTGRREPTDTVHWVAILDLYDAEPWIEPCEHCTVTDADSSHQAGCDNCRGRGWFNTTTGLPVKLWWWQADLGAAANWLIHTLTPTLLRAAGYTDDADRIDKLPRITAEHLTRRITGTGMLEQLHSRLERNLYDRMQTARVGSSSAEPVRLSVTGHPVWDRARNAYLDFRTSRAGEWAYRIAMLAPELIDAEPPGSTAQLTTLLDDLVDAYENETAGLLMVEEDIILGPERPILHGASGRRCESRYAWNGALHQCAIVTPPRADHHHMVDVPDPTKPDGIDILEWTDDDNVDVRCPSTFIGTIEDRTLTVQCDDNLHRHPDYPGGVLVHHWMSDTNAPGSDYPDLFTWTDADAASNRRRHGAV